MDLKKIWDKVKKYPNVVGYSQELQYRIRNGQVINELCFRVYVSKKIPKNELRAVDIIPEKVEDIPIDVVEVGELKALSVDKKSKFRPVIFGISIGHIMITAGTNGFLFQDNKGNVYFGSNAHVFTPDPSLKPEDITIKDIVQPGPYDGGTLLDKVAEYYWHKKIEPIDINHCPISKFVVNTLNLISKALGRKSRFKVYQEVTNKIDFAVAVPTTSYEVKFPDMDISGKRFVGLGFAGSDISSVVCKAKNIIAEGYTPVGVEVTDVKIGDTVEKTGRTSCHTQAKVIDTIAVVTVSYGNYRAIFEDVILTSKLLEPGDSGSSIWK